MTRPRKAQASLSIVAISLLLAGCTQAHRPQAETFPKIAGEPTQWRRIHPVGVALPEGRPFVGAATPSYDDRPVLVNIWASYCGYCVDELPMLERFHRRHHLRIEGISNDSIPRKARRAAAAAHLTYPNVLDPDFLHSLGGVVPAELPVSLLVRHGTITAVHVGPFVSARDLARVETIDG